MKDKKIKDRTIESSSQADVLVFMEKRPNTWFTTEQIREALGLKTREKIATFLRRLIKSDFVESKRVSGTNELLYKVKKIKIKNGRTQTQ